MNLLKWLDPLWLAHFCTLWGGKGGGGGTMLPDPNIGIAAAKQAQTGQDMLDFMKQSYEESKPRQAEFDALTKQVSNLMIEQTQFSQERAKEGYQREQNLLYPLQDKMQQEAMDFGNEAMQKDEAARASSEVARSFEATQGRRGIAMARYGLRPGDEYGKEMDMSQAATQATASNEARRSTKLQGIAMRQGVANQFMGMSGQATAAGGLAASSGGAGIGAAMSGNNMLMARQNQVMAGGQAAMSGYGGQASALNQQFNTQSSNFNAQAERDAAAGAGTGQMIGSVVGIAAVAI